MGNRKQLPALEDIARIRNTISELRAEGEKIISHYKKLDEYYADWQDRLYEVEKEIMGIETDYGLPKEQIAEYDAFDDINALIAQE